MRHALRASFYTTMVIKENIGQVINDFLETRTDLFLINFKIDEKFKVIINLDGDQGVNLQDCIDLSKAIDAKVDREEQDFSMEVASVGATSALRFPRQFVKNIGRRLSVKVNDDIFEGDLTAATNDDFTLEWKAREPKKIGKGKETVEKKQVFAYNEVSEAKVIIIF